MKQGWDDYEDAPGVPSPEITTPEKIERIFDRIVGQQISRLIEFAPGSAPEGGAAVGFELRSHARAVYWALPVPRRLTMVPYLAAWSPQWFVQQNIITPRMDRRLASSRAGDEMTWNPLYYALEGLWVRSCSTLEEPNRFGGQDLKLELTERTTLTLQALPGRAHGLASKHSANYRLKLDREKRLISLPSEFGL